LETIRLFFEKKGIAKYLSHLDTMRCFTRAVKITGYKAWYTEGFNPHLYLLFASPLSLGFESNYEVVDLRLDESSDLNDFVSRMNMALPDGIHVNSASKAVMSYKDVGYSSWRILINVDDAVTVKKTILEYVDQKEILISRSSKRGVVRTEDIKQYIRKISIECIDSTVIIYADFTTNTSVSLNPQVFMENFWVYSEMKNIPLVKITRDALLDNKGNLFK